MTPAVHEPEIAQRPIRRPRVSRMCTIGALTVAAMIIACIGSLPYTLGRTATTASPTTASASRPELPRRFEAGDTAMALQPPSWAPHTAAEQAQLDDLKQERGSVARSWLGTDRLGRSMMIRCLTGGGISLCVGLSAAAIAVVIGTLWGTIAGWCGGRVDSLMMRIVDVLFGLPTILLIVLLAVAIDGLTQQAATGDKTRGWWQSLGNVMHDHKDVVNIITLLVAIGGVSWLTMARVIRGQVLSLKNQPFMEACRAIGVPLHRQFLGHLLPNLLGPIIVYATLAVPSAILSESFLSFLGIGVQEPLPSWGNLAASGLSELNIVRARWWLLLWPCLLIAITLLSLNFVGEGLRERFDPRQR